MRSIWTLPVDKITAEDLDSFLQQRLAENQQLDYKRAVDKSLAKSVASFANTVGGLIVFGVDTDESNQPLLPPRGVPRAEWKTDSITQICSDSINPAILPGLSNTFPNPHDNDGEDTILAILRVEQSPLAPHAVDQSTRVPVRVKDITKSIDWADVDRIGFMLKRRERYDDLRAEFLERSLGRLRRVTPGELRHHAAIWFSVTPEFPWRPVTSDSNCENFSSDINTQRAPRGVIGRHITRNGAGEVQRVSLVSIENTGSIFRGNAICKPIYNSLFLDLQVIMGEASKFFWHCQHFLKSERILHPGILRLSIGLENVGGYVMQYLGQISTPMIDDSFSTDLLSSYERFSESNFNGMAPPKEIALLMRNLGHAFGFEVHVEPGLE